MLSSPSLAANDNKRERIHFDNKRLDEKHKRLDVKHAKLDVNNAWSNVHEKYAPLRAIREVE